MRPPFVFDFDLQLVLLVFSPTFIFFDFHGNFLDRFSYYSLQLFTFRDQPRPEMQKRSLCQTVLPWKVSALFEILKNQTKKVTGVPSTSVSPPQLIMAHYKLKSLPNDFEFCTLFSCFLMQGLCTVEIPLKQTSNIE